MTETSTTSRRSWVLAGVSVLTVLVGLVLIWGAWTLQQTSEESSELRDQLEHATTFDVSDEALPPVDITPAPAEDLQLTPMLLIAPGAGLRVPLVDMGLTAEGNFAIAPAAEAGVYTGSAPLSSDIGSTLITGHVSYPDSGELAPMSSIAALWAGDLVVTVDASGVRQDWRVVSAEVVPRDGLRPQMWSWDGERQLVLITCAGQTGEVAEGVEFTENLVVTAVPNGGTP